MDLLEIFGYCGSVLVAISLTMKNILKLRWINLIGAATFSIYGLLVGAYPVFVLNAFIAAVDIYYLIDMYRTKESFSFVPVLNDNHIYLNKFIDFYKQDIQKYFPNFIKQNLKNTEYYFILRDLIPAGLFAYEKISDSEALLHLDYATPVYQDFKISGYVYSAKSTFLNDKGIKKLYTHSDVPQHISYLQKIGFVATENKNEYAITL